MAKATQPYPRIQDESNKLLGFLDTAELNEHKRKISERVLKRIIAKAIDEASRKSSRSLLNLADTDDLTMQQAKFQKVGHDLFGYFKKYYGDPASTAHDCHNQHYRDIAREQFRNNTIQKERMNSGWRYQFIAKDAANRTGRVISVSDIGTAEADFNATVGYKNKAGQLNIYVSVKNRGNTLGGQDWPNSIQALEEVASRDRNRSGPYICVFGIAMDRGQRTVKKDAKRKVPYSVNTEIWYSDFFWPFFSNIEYEEIIKAVLDVLIEHGRNTTFDTDIPADVLEGLVKSAVNMDC